MYVLLMKDALRSTAFAEIKMQWVPCLYMIQHMLCIKRIITILVLLIAPMQADRMNVGHTVKEIPCPPCVFLMLEMRFPFRAKSSLV